MVDVTRRRRSANGKLPDVFENGLCARAAGKHERISHYSSVWRLRHQHAAAAALH